MSRSMSELRQEEFRLIAHDVRNHVVAVMRNLELLHRGAAGPINESQAEVLRATRDCTELVLGLTADILDLSKIERGQMKLVVSQFDLVQVIGETTRLARGLGADKDLTVVFETRCAAARICADRSRIARILVNIFMNAVDFSPNGGTLLVTCSQGAAGEFVVGVRDDGPGIPREQQRRVFQKYYQVPGQGARARHGLGLGLYFCKKTIDAHGGRIWVESPPRRRAHGSEVLFALPGSRTGDEA